MNPQLDDKSVTDLIAIVLVEGECVSILSDLEMESALWNILQFNPGVRDISLVSTDWQRNLNENAELVLGGVRRTYPADTLHDSMIKAIVANNITLVNNVASIQSYAPINWNDLSRYVRTGRMANIITHRISVEAEETMRDRLIRDNIDIAPMDWVIQDDDPRAYLKLFHRMINQYCPFFESDRIIKKAINRFGVGKIPMNVRVCLRERGIISFDEINAPFEEAPICDNILPSQEFIDLILDTYQGRGSHIGNFARIRDMLSNPQCVSLDTVNAVLQYVTSNPGPENITRGKALTVAIINGWDHILDKYLTINNVLASISGALMKYRIDPRTWRYLSYANMNPSWFRYYANLQSRPSDLEPTFWRKLLANAVVNGNIPLIRSIANKHRNKIDRKIELDILNLSRKQGTYSVELMNALKG